MDGGDRQGLRTPFEKYGFLVLLLAAGGFFFLQAPLKPSRPAGGPPPPPEGGWVNARLWQDPLDAARHAPDSAKNQARRARIELSGGAMVLPVYTAAGSTADEKEERLRSRYAVLAAFEAAGYVPEETERIGFLGIGGPPDKSSGTGELWIPFEWLKKNPLGRPASGEKRQLPERVLVLWLGGDRLYTDPLGTLREIAAERLKGEAGTWRVIGPADSDMLISLLVELKQNKQLLQFKGFEKLRIFSPWATADPAILRTLCGDCPFQVMEMERIESARQLQRTIASDLEVVTLLLKELRARGVDLAAAGDHVVLLSDWDTLYGRALPLTFAGAVRRKQGGEREDFSESLRAVGGDLRNWPKQLRPIMYLRGLDGSRPEGSAPTESAKKDGGLLGAVKPAEGDIERPVGEHQLDYARRVADQLALEKGGEVKAIGVLGSDVYDKLLLLQALRPRFPDALMFTTDLDARLLHPGETKWARNLIVASSYGLDVPREFRDTGDEEWAKHSRGRTFRNNYQTATYFAVLRALGLVNAEALRTASDPWIYEIGRTRAHRLPSVGQTGGEQVLYPTREVEVFMTARSWVLLGVAALLLFLSALLVYHFSFGPAIWKDPGWQTRACWKLGYLAVVLSVFFVVSLRATGPPEPLTWFEGISIWPTELIRFAAGLLAVTYLVRAQQRIRETNESIRKQYSIRDVSAQTELPEGFWRRSACLLARGPFGTEGSLSGLWYRYECCSAPKNRWARVLPLWLFYFGFALCLFYLFGQPRVPYRGPDSLILDRAMTMLSVGLLLLLVFYVLETILVTERLLRQMVKGAEKDQPEYPGGWPDDPPEPERRAWFTIDLIARLTSPTGSLILYPFVVLTLIIFSRLNYFDRWDWPASLIIVLGINALLVLGSAVWLNRTAARVRNRCFEGLRRFQFDMERRGEDQRAEAIGKVMAQVEQERRGAFAPLREHPVLGAVALPSSSMLLALLLDFLDRAA